MQTAEIAQTGEIRGIEYPRGERFRRILVTGPPGSGKSTLIMKLRGWPEEGYLDLAEDSWWRNRVLAYRPRELHLGLPFIGHERSHAVFDKEWLEEPGALDLKRIMIPPLKRRFWQRDWRSYFLFDFQLPPAKLIFEKRKERKAHGTHPVDVELTQSMVNQQVAIYMALAEHLHRSGLRVIVRNSFQGTPRYIL